ncbi:Alpha/beta hydrolase fold protein OS=Tsukamurella paurometabola (strain ATCC 8368 / DSM / CCUG 35730 / CIP 100753 / JCM 10117 / KCTC 9821 / NBRC 16120 /NCIMB 702349 / NCTC 13040) OX=521096 GN=Tpau_2475 PE=4 SV=1 [Tsukamurella paurometabola]|uniref:Alpha/beta hydrolase fold protein n=1 Tax=Tsukamurella paurometabola (strain ATCC 8368 / DSM 20162 / CCUG 35730 / CIP 100753 / JCM 10117 / KCTC 9821 / NBRC 16120 / NCIMB 702349 / NCTC 13040) TaxID=521096 RepID=D5UR91_TSUPD|nr:haloalkane dehalogenase [Tsukamurella paurometabola]ADG79080.1 alpha/beta hydrolase fold protein [Tsukamurella paurometabola DSM 20162]SUP34006.1 Haloalkane dehalogenase [Tsukamurella paurometabola]
MFVDVVPDRGLYPFESRWFTSSAGRMHYIDEGSGPVLLFCHGTPTWSFVYRRIVTALRDRYRCIAVDHLGFGLSERPDGFGYTIPDLSSALGELIDDLDLDGVVVMGQDWGGPIGFGAAVRRAERVRGIVLGNAVFWPNDGLDKRIFSAVMSSRPMQRRIVDENLMVDRVLASELGTTLSAAEFEHYRAVQSVPEARAALAVMPKEIRAARPFLAALEREVPRCLGGKPALAVWGMRDKVFRPRACLPRIRRAFTDLEVVELPGSGHVIQESAPSAIAAAIARRFPV